MVVFFDNNLNEAFRMFVLNFSGVLHGAIVFLQLIEYDAGNVGS